MQLTDIEPLDPSLEPFVDREAGLIRHPLVYAMYNVLCNAQYNQQLRDRRRDIEAAETHGNHNRYVFLHERPYRFRALSMIAPKIQDPNAYWTLFRQVWEDSENISEVSGIVGELLDHHRQDRRYVMTAHERQTLAGMSLRFPVYRGTRDPGDPVNAYSWSTDIRRARWYGSRRGAGYLLHGTVRRSEVIALFEVDAEVLIAPGNVTVQRTTELVSSVA